MCNPVVAISTDIRMYMHADVCTCTLADESASGYHQVEGSEVPRQSIDEAQLEELAPGREALDDVCSTHTPTR